MDPVDSQWYREANTRGLHYIVLVYEKAEGFVFCPTDAEHPFRVGGDYDGCRPVNAAQGLDYLKRSLQWAYRQRAEWLIPFAERIARGENFSLDDLQLETRKVRLIHGQWPW